MKKITAKFITLFLIICGCIACSHIRTGRESYDFSYTKPPETKDGWHTASLADVGLNSNKIGRLLYNIQKGEIKNIYAVIVAKDGLLVVDEYFNGADRRNIGLIASTTKSLVSILLGIALDESTSNKNVNTTLLDFFPGYSDRIHQNGKEAITLYHLLTMTAGLDWDEITYPHPHERNPNTQISRFELKPFSRQSFYGHWEAVGDVHIDFVESETGNVSEADIHCLLGTMKFRKTDGHDLWPIKKHITFQSNGQLGL